MLSHRMQRQLARAGFVLAGGKSSRMGTDKALLVFQGHTLLERALAVMAAVCDTVTVVGDPARFAEYSFAAHSSGKYKAGNYETPKHEPVVADVFPGCGPLAGIHTALAHSTAQLNLMLAVDMPFVSEELLAFLFAAAENNNAAVTLPRTSQGLQPLCAVYRHEFLALAETALRAGKYKVDAVFSAVSTHEIDAAELAAAGFAERSFFNVNTPADRLTALGE
jgi:molybdopterin-guanine dinucleotide biosynthesis protein A